MPNWRKVIVSGSDAALNSLNVTAGVTGSLLGTASFAATASFINVTGSNAFVQGGNSFGAQAVLGTNDNQSLAFETSGSVRMFVSSSGVVGVRTINPEYTFDVSGSIRANGSFVFATDGTGGNGLSFVRNGSNNWTWGTSGIGNVMLIQGNSITLPQVVYSTNGLNSTPGGNQTTYALGVTVGSYPSATIASFSSGSVTALTISGSGMRGTGSFQYSGSITTNNITATQNVTASSARFTTVPAGSSETNIVVLDAGGNLKYRSNLSLQGTQGATGTQGAVGTQGTVGAQGTVGTQGITGTQGTTGTQGAVGTQGTVGAQGSTGTQGAVGTQGTIGAQGAVGSQGTTGTQGAVGTQGTIGAQGAVGSRYYRYARSCRYNRSTRNTRYRRYARYHW